MVISPAKKMREDPETFPAEEQVTDLEKRKAFRGLGYGSSKRYPMETSWVFLAMEMMGRDIGQGEGKAQGDFCDGCMNDIRSR